MDRGKPVRPQPWTENYRQLRKVESRRNGLPEGGAHPSVIQYQMVGSKNMYIHVTYGQSRLHIYIYYIYIYTFTYTFTYIYLYLFRDV